MGGGGTKYELGSLANEGEEETEKEPPKPQLQTGSDDTQTDELYIWGVCIRW